MVKHISSACAVIALALLGPLTSATANPFEYQWHALSPAIWVAIRPDPFELPQEGNALHAAWAWPISALASTTCILIPLPLRSTSGRMKPVEASTDRLWRHADVRGAGSDRFAERLA